MRSDNWLAEQLPAGMTEDRFLMQFLSIFQHLSDTVLQQVDTLADVFDPAVAPPSMIEAMAGWLGIDWLDPDLDERLQREIVRTYARNLPRRGTAGALEELLRWTCCLPGQTDVDVDVTVRDVIEGERSSGIYRSGRDEPPGPIHHVEVKVSSSGVYHPDDLARIVRSEVPLNLALRMTVADRTVWPPGADEARVEHAGRQQAGREQTGVEAA